MTPTSARPLESVEDPARLLRAWREALADEVRIDRYIRLAREVEATDLPRSFTALRVLVASTFTLQTIEPMMRGLCYLEGIAPDIRFLPPPQLEEGLTANAESWDLVIVAAEVADLAPPLLDGGQEAADDRVALREALQDRLARLVTLAHERTGGVVVVHNFAVPTDRVFGILEPRMEATPAHTIRALNEFLEALSRRHPFVHVLDVDRLAGLHGKAGWRDPRLWHAGRLGLVNRPARMVAEEYLRFIRVLRGRVVKCVVLDCDHTLWGGTAGEDGVEGIQLGEGYPGCCYVELQKALLVLLQRGVLLALNSRNNEADVFEIIDRHPAMRLRRAHLAAYRVNWQDKATNLVELARELDLGLESLVYVDDDPVEVAWVAQALPAVTTVCVSRTPTEVLRRFHDGVHVDALAVTAEDRGRTRLYAAERERDTLKDVAGSLEAFLAQLAMQATIWPLRATDLPRAAQLAQRTSQFNLTARCYSEAALGRLRQAGGHRLLGVSLADRFGDSGTVGLVILSLGDLEALEIDTFLLSCRVIGRTLEQTVLAHLVAVARGVGYRRVRGHYVPTPKNKLVEGLYSRFGFTQVDDAGRVWERETTPALAPSPWIRLTV